MKYFYIWLLFSAWVTPVWSQVEVRLKLSPAGQFQAKTSSLEGQVKVQGEKVLAEQIKVDLRTLKTGIELRDKHMKEKYLQVDRYPYAILKTGEGKNGQGQGELEIRGISKPVQGTYSLKGNKVEARFKINLSDYQISGIRYMGVGVKDEAEILVTVPAKRD